MKNMRFMKENILIRKAVEVLIKELGPLEAVRFITIPVEKRMESIKRHREWQKSLDKECFFSKIFRT